MNNKLYISGKITGDPSYPQKFEAACLVASKKDFYTLYGGDVAKYTTYTSFAPICPTELAFLGVPLHYCPYWACMISCIVAMVRCSSVYFLRDWRGSKGARIEHKIAKLLNKNIIYQIPTL